jgi:hypothetical protein
VSDVDVANRSKIANERRRAPRHVSRQDGCRLAQSDGPPRPAVTRDEPAICTEPARDSQELLYRTSVLRRKPLEFLRQIDHAAQQRGVGQRRARGEQLSRAGDTWEQHARRKPAARDALDPDGVRASHLAAVHAAERAEFDEIRRDALRRARERRPACSVFEPFASHRTPAFESLQSRDGGHPLQPEMARSAADFEASDHGRTVCIAEGA